MKQDWFARRKVDVCLRPTHHPLMATLGEQKTPAAQVLSVSLYGKGSDANLQDSLYSGNQADQPGEHKGDNRR